MRELSPNKLTGANAGEPVESGLVSEFIIGLVPVVAQFGRSATWERTRYFERLKGHE